MSANARIAETFTLPSRGLIYEETVNPEVTLSSMKTKHEMMRLSATTNSNKIMSDIIDDCIQNDIGISAYDLCLGDYQFLLYKLRIVTFGPDYEMAGACPHCGAETFINVNLDDLEVKEFSKELSKNLTVKLPNTGREITLTLQTPRMLDKITRQTADRKRRMRNNNENASLLYTLTSSIVAIDGDEPDPFTLEDWVRDLPLADSNFLIKQINEINSMIGVQTEIEDVCTTCARYYVAPFRITEQFFRPDIK